MPITKLSKQAVEEIYIELREGTQMKDIAPMFDISRTMISKFIKDAMDQAVRGSGEDLIPTVILGEYNNPEMLALVRLPDLLNLLSAALGDSTPPLGEGDDYDVPSNYGGTDPE